MTNIWDITNAINAINGRIIKALMHLPFMENYILRRSYERSLLTRLKGVGITSAERTQLLCQLYSMRKTWKRIII